ncbi:MAG: hypothetical protein QXY96_07420 [Candidatus Methanomethylicaceae archaeon]
MFDKKKLDECVNEIIIAYKEGNFKKIWAIAFYLGCFGLSNEWIYIRDEAIKRLMGEIKNEARF